METYLLFVEHFPIDFDPKSLEKTTEILYRKIRFIFDISNGIKYLLHFELWYFGLGLNPGLFLTAICKSASKDLYKKLWPLGKKSRRFYPPKRNLHTSQNFPDDYFCSGTIPLGLDMAPQRSKFTDCIISILSRVYTFLKVKFLQQYFNKKSRTSEYMDRTLKLPNT